MKIEDIKVGMTLISTYGSQVVRCLILRVGTEQVYMRSEYGIEGWFRPWIFSGVADCPMMEDEMEESPVSYWDAICNDCGIEWQSEDSTPKCFNCGSDNVDMMESAFKWEGDE